MKKFVAVLSLFVIAIGAANAAPTYVGSYQVDGGGAAPAWGTNPPTYTGQEAAALLFGGSPDDYFISIDPSQDPSSITHTAHEDIWAGPDTIFAENAKIYAGNYNDLGFPNSASSAYVYDHADSAVNYVWRVNRDDVPAPNGAPVTPEPCSIATLLLGGIGLAFKKRLA